MKGDIDIMGGPNFDRLYHNKTENTVTVMLLILL